MRSDSEFLANVKTKHEKALADRRVRRKRAAYAVSALFVFAVICTAVVPVITRFGNMKNYNSDGGTMYEADGEPIPDENDYNAAPNIEDNVEELPNYATDKDGVKSVEGADPERAAASAEKLELVGTLDGVEIYTASAGGYIFKTDETEYFVSADDLETAIERYKSITENETEKAG